RVLLILETLANADGMTLSELSLKTDISKGTIFPILKSLQYRKLSRMSLKTPPAALALLNSLQLATCSNAVLNISQPAKRARP
ncbi:helix-turn-helix domain-containing protein, partial [Klebsiella michiganensis]|uniref:helix-turn-helix domain-containing protein n=1 Tax=Klebsiella michiganensis TaxID=1134687 RepID=UPI001E51B3E3